MFRKRKAIIRIAALGDQVLFSAANFVLTIILARFYDEIALAAYGIAISVAMTIAAVQQTTYIVQNAVLSPFILRRRVQKVFGQQLAVWLIVFAVEFIVLFIGYMIWDHSEYFRYTCFATVVCTLLYLHISFDRIVMIKHERFIDPLLSSAIFLAIIGAMFFAVPRYDISFEILMSLIGIFLVVKNIWIAFVIGRPDFFWGWRLLMRDAKKYLAASLVGVVGTAGFKNFPIFLLASVGAPIQTAAYGAMRSLMQPAMIVLRSLDIIDKNYFQQGGTSRAAMQKTLFRLLAIYGGLFLSALVVMYFIAEPVVRLVYGEKYAIYSSLLVGWGGVFLFIGITSPIETVIVKLDRLNAYNIWRIPAGIVGIVLSYILCKDYQAWGAIAACLAGWLCSVSAGLWLIRDVVFHKRKVVR